MANPSKNARASIPEDGARRHMTAETTVDNVLNDRISFLVAYNVAVPC